jgi:tetratricopeptide (TPR) repeat protein
MVRLIKAYILLAVILGDLLPEKELTKTVELSNKALSLSREINQKELIARSLLHKGNELRKHGNVAEAIIHLTRAKDLASNDLLRGYAAQALARAYGKTGDRRKFEDALSESLDLVSSSNDGKYNLGTVREVQARANLVIGNIDDAAKYLEEGEQYLDPMLAPWRPIYKITKAHTYLASGEWDRGTILLIESVRLAKLYNLPHQMERLKKIPKSVPVSIRLRTEKLIRDILDQQNYITPIAE